MKHLKRFNEKIQWNKDRPELLEFCEDNLAYLLDKNFDVSVRLYPMRNNTYSGGIRDEGYISIYPNRHGVTFKWNEVKDDFITFLEMLIIKYGLLQEEVKITLLYSSGMMKVFSGDDINKILDGRLVSRGIAGNLEEIRVENK
jgi:hypothetical protein